MNFLRRWRPVRVIKDNKIVEDSWQRVELSEELPEGDVIFPFNYWREHRDELQQHNGKLGICLNGDDEVEDLADEIDQFDLVALEFPKFNDGRCYSHARLLRERYAYAGELRAVGDVLRDQLFYMKRCGIDSFQVREDKDIEDALKGLSDFSVTYQTAADGALPIYKVRS